MNIGKLLKNRIFTGAMIGFLAVMMLITGSLSGRFEVAAADGDDNSSVLTAYKWTRIRSASDLPSDKYVDIVMVRNDKYITLGDGIKKSHDDWKHYHDDEYMQYFKMSSVPSELQVSLDEFYTLDGEEKYKWWHCYKYGNHMHLYTNNWKELVADDDDNDSCLDTGSFVDGEEAWRFEIRKDTFRFQHWSSYYDEYMGTTGDRIWCENTSDDPSWDGMDGFALYMIQKEAYTCLNGNLVVEAGQVLNISTGWVMKPYTTLTIEPGGVVNVMGKFWCNGTVKNYGTLILREKSEMYSFVLPKRSNYNSSVCSIDNFGGGCQCNLKNGGKAEGEGVMIIMKDAFLMTNKYSDPLDFYGTATFENYGTAILYNGLRCGDNNKESNAEIFNYGQIGMGSSIDPTACAASKGMFDFSGNTFKIKNYVREVYVGNMCAGVSGSANVKEIKMVKSMNGETGTLKKDDGVYAVRKTGVELFRYVNTGTVKASSESGQNYAEITSGLGQKRADIYKSNDYTNLYALSIGTGFSSGASVQYIGVRYRGIDGLERTEYLFPSYGGLKTSYDRAATVAAGTSIAQTKQNILGQYGVRMSENAVTESLGKNTNEDYIFKTSVPVREILGFDIMNGSQEWSCKYIALYEIDSIEGIDMKGYVSSQRYIDYSGTRIFIWERTTDTNISTDRLFQFRCTVSGDTKLEKIDGVITRHWTTADSSAQKDPVTSDTIINRVIGSASGRMTITEEPYIKAKTVSQAITIDMSSVAGAGISGFVQNYDSCISLDGKWMIDNNGNRVTNTSTGKMMSDKGEMVSDNTKDVGIGSYEECLTLNVKYYDTNNIYNDVNIPVFYSTLCYLCGEAEMGDKFIYGLGQADDTLAFKFTLPGYDSTRGMELSLYYGTAYATESCGINYDKYYTHRTVSTDDEISLVGIQIYNQMPRLEVTDSRRLSTTKVGQPTQYYTAPTKLGTKLTYDDAGSGKLDLRTLLQTFDEKTSSLTPRSTGEMYMVQMTTTIPTKNKTYITFGYTQQNGKSAVTNAYFLQDEVESYYGLWTAYKGGAYELTAKPGATFYFLIDAKNASKFDYAIVRVEGRKGESDMQINSFRIFKLGNETNATGTVSYTFDPKHKISGYADVAGDCYSYWNIDRTVSATTPFVNYAEERLVRSGSQEQISFAECSSTIENLSDVNWDEYREYMSYSSTQQDMGYTKVRNVYTVTVKVAADSDVANSDSGSKNKFYFQLLFDSGDTTGYVLANQQLLSDGFRSGYEESFKIYSNYDYGDLAAVRIIPDDQQEGSDVFDKLCIEYITISKQTNAGISRTWRCEINDWVGIDYNDSAAQDGVKPQQGRTEAEMSRAYAVTQKGYDVLLVVEFETGDYTLKKNDGSVATYPNINCSLNYEVTYTNQTGQVCLATGDAAAAMYEFMDYEPMMGVKWTGKDVIAIDPNNMMRANSTNKFIVALDNPKTINSITFTANGDRENSYAWKLGKVKVYRITGGTGALYFDSKRNYCRRYDMTLLTESTHTGYKSTIIPVDGKSQALTADFRIDQDNEIEIDSDMGTWTSTIGRVPDSAQDNLMIFLFMNKDFNDSTAGYDMKMSVDYIYDGRNIVGGISTKTSEAMQHDDTNKVFYSKIAVNGFQSVESLSFVPVTKGGSLEVDPDTAVYADYVMIVQERYQVIIDVFYLDLHRSGVPINLAASLTKSYDGSMVKKDRPEFNDGTQASTTNYTSNTSQTVSFSIGEAGSHGIKLSRDEQSGVANDIGFYYSFVIDGDPTNTTYMSPKYFLSDEHNGETIKPHQQFEIETNLPAVKEIKNVKFFALGELKEYSARDKIDNRVNIDAFSMNIRKTGKSASGTEEVMSEIKYIADDLTNDNFVITESDKTMGLNIYNAEDGDRHTVAYTTITLNTQNNTADVDASCTTPIWCKVTWVTGKGEERSIIMNDIRDYLQSGDFTSGGTAVVTVPMYNYGKLHSISFEPYDDESSQSTWALDKLSVTVKLNDGTTEEIKDKVVQKMFKESLGTYEEGADRPESAAVNLANISFAATAHYYYRDLDELFADISLTTEEWQEDDNRRKAVAAVLNELTRSVSEGGSGGSGMNIPREPKDNGYDGNFKITAGTELTLVPNANLDKDVTSNDSRKFVKGSFRDVNVEIYELHNNVPTLIQDTGSILTVVTDGATPETMITTKIIFKPINNSNEFKEYLIKIVSKEFSEKYMTVHVTVDKSLLEKVTAATPALPPAPEPEHQSQEDINWEIVDNNSNQDTPTPTPDATEGGNGSDTADNGTADGTDNGTADETDTAGETPAEETQEADSQPAESAETP